MGTHIEKWAVRNTNLNDHFSVSGGLIGNTFSVVYDCRGTYWYG